MMVLVMMLLLMMMLLVLLILILMLLLLVVVLVIRHLVELHSWKVCRNLRMNRRHRHVSMWLRPTLLLQM
jgi:hypothetical protein